jgi:hypothetical protein
MSAEAAGPVGITGHQALTPATKKLVSRAVEEYFSHEGLLVAITSLAAGTDQICAQVMLDLGGKIVVVLPSEKYEQSFQLKEDRAAFRRYLARADCVVRMPFTAPSEEAYWAAGQEIVKRSSQLLAVWDGRPAGGLGGTADVVRYAYANDKSVTTIWPEGARRG